MFKKFDLVLCRVHSFELGVIVSDKFDCHYFQDGMAINYSQVPFDIENSENWKNSFKAYAVYVLVKNSLDFSPKIEIIAEHSLRMYDKTQYTAPLYDWASSQTRLPLSILKFVEKIEKERKNNEN